MAATERRPPISVQRTEADPSRRQTVCEVLGVPKRPVRATVGCSGRVE